MFDVELIESLRRYLGRTVTIFTTSGGLSGAGFTGVLAAVCDGTVKLITDIGAPPACPIGSACMPYSTCGDGYGFGGFGGFGGCGFGGNNWLGSVTEIPLARIASFVHSTI